MEGKAVHAQNAPLHLEPGDLECWQREDLTLHQAWQTTEATPEGSPRLQGPTFKLYNNLLYRRERLGEGEYTTQFLITGLAWGLAMQLIHNIPMTGHLGPKKTLQIVLQ